MVFSNGLLFGASAEAGGGGGGFDTALIPNSIELNGSDERFSRNTSGSPSTTKLIMACWFQLIKIPLSANQGLMFQGNASGSGSDQVGLFFSYDSATIEMDLYFYCNGNRATPNMAFRDLGWYHILASYDLGQSGTDKGKLFINGVEITSYNQDLRASYGTSFNSTATQQVGGMATAFFPGYIAQPVMLDGQSVQAGDVAITDFVDAFTFGTNGSQFVPKANADIAALATTAGGNSFCLDFETTGGTSEANLGLDISDNSNNLTPANMAASNQSTNTPSKNFSIFNPLANGDSTGVGSFTLSNGNKTAALTSSNSWLKTTIPFVMSGSNIIRTQFTIDTVGDSAVGITGSPHTAGTYHTSGLGHPGQGEVLLLSSGAVVVDGNFGSSGGYTSSWSASDVIDVIVNLDVGAVWFARNGTLGGSATQAEIQAGTTTNAALVTSFVRRKAGEVFNFYVAQWNPSNPTFTYNSGQTAFSNSYSTITSLVPLSTADLAAPDFQGIDYFNAVLHTGNGTAIGSGGKAVTGVGFKPDWTWIKNRDAADSHSLYDIVRGVTKQIETNTATVESTQSEGLTTFGSDGFTVGSLAQVNTNTEDYVSWNWLGSNTTSTTSPAGSIASTSSVADAGHFSVLKYTGSTGAARTVGHGLGGVAEAIIVHNLGSSGANWPVLHEALGSVTGGGGNYILINGTGDKTYANINYWNDTSPTDEVFTIGSGATPDTNAAQDFIAYCFRSVPGGCKVGSYRGNSDDDGAYIFCGFKPRWLIVKETTVSDTAQDWFAMDTARYIFNGTTTAGGLNGGVLCPNENFEEKVTYFTDNPGYDILSDGFKLRTNSGTINGTGRLMIYIAMADIGGGGTLPPIYGR